MLVVLDTLLEDLDVVLVPPPLELLAPGPEQRDQLVEPGIVHAARVGRAQLGNALAAVLVPVHQDRPHAVAEEELVERVPLDALESGQVAVDDGGRVVPGQDVPPFPEHPGRAEVHLIDEALEAEAHRHRARHVGAAGWNRVAAEREQMAGLMRLEPERLGDPGEHLRRGTHVARLLEPGIPLGAHPGHRRDLFAPEAGRAPAAATGQTQLFRLSAHPAGPEEVGDLSPALVAQHRPFSRLNVRMTVRCRPSQTRPPACPSSLTARRGRSQPAGTGLAQQGSGNTRITAPLSLDSGMLSWIT